MTTGIAMAIARQYLAMLIPVIFRLPNKIYMLSNSIDMILQKATVQVAISAERGAK